uniref:CCHC-type domain-containing protein n=1 Tax=Panagrolaimus sp. ES5 TaxID=591445 RepID=A0AC34EZA9_9BILA
MGLVEMSTDLSNLFDQAFGKLSKTEVKDTSVGQIKEVFENFVKILNAKITVEGAEKDALATVSAKFIEFKEIINCLKDELADIQEKMDAFENTEVFSNGPQKLHTSWRSGDGGAAPALQRPVAVVNMMQQIEKTTDKVLPEYSISSEQSFAEWAERFKDILAASDITTEARKIALLSDGEHAAMAKLKIFPAMLEGQSLMVYAEKLEKLVNRALKEKAAEIISQRLLEEFLDRMPYNLAFYVREKVPTDFYEALNHARKFEAIWAIPPRPVANAIPKTVNIAEVTDSKNEISKLRLEMQQNGTQRSQAFVECFYCKEYGHYARDCAKKRERMFTNNGPGYQRRDNDFAASGIENADSRKIRELEMRVELLLNQNNTLANGRRCLDLSI